MRPAPPDSSTAPPYTALIAVVGAPGQGQSLLVPALRAALSDAGVTVVDDNGLILAPPQRPISLCLLIPSPAPGDPVEAQLRLALIQRGQSFSVLSGPLQGRLSAALAAWQAHLREGQREGCTVSQAPSRWRHHCGRCGDGDCERQLFDPLSRRR